MYTYTRMLKTQSFVGLDVLTAVAEKSSIFWDIMPYSPLKVGQHFGRLCRHGEMFLRNS
jgi:hypothetical protein